MADTKVGINVVATNNASGTLTKVKADLTDLGKSAGQVNSVSSAFSNLGSAVTVAGLAFGALKVGQQVAELAQLGASAQRLEASFQTLSQQAGISSNVLLSSLQKASQGTISNTDLMLSANKALVLGVGESADDMTKLLEVAVARGKALGLSSTQAFSDIITGIGRESPLILDNLGIKVKDITAGIQEYANAHGRVVEQLTAEERKRAIINSVIASSAGLVQANASAAEDNATKIERLSASWENLKTTVGEVAADSLGGLDAISQAADYVSSHLQQMTDFSSATGQAKRAAYDLDLVKGKLDALSAVGAGNNFAGWLAGYDALIKKQADLKVALTFATDAMRYEAAEAAYAAQSANQMAAAGSGAAASMVNQASAAANLGGSLAVLSGEFQRVIALQNVFAGQQAGLASIAGQVIGAAGQEEGLKFLRQSTNALSEQQQEWQNAGYSVAEVNALSIAYNDNLRKTTETTYGYGAAAVKANKAAAAAVKAVNAEYEDLKGKVSGVLSGALSDVGGVDVGSILPRSDSVSEDARRLADVAVNGFASPWADYLANKFPDTIGAAFSSGADIKQSAAQLLKDFQDGLRPELLDKGKAKELVRRAILGEQNLKALTDEIAKELASEMGISVEKAQAAAASALGGGGATGGGSSVGATSPKQVPIVPVIDTSKLPTTPISIKANVTSITIDEAVQNPQIASTAAIGSIVIAQGVEYPTPILAGGLIIGTVGIRSDATMPDVIVPLGYLAEIVLLASATLPNITLPIGYLKEIGLFANVVLPNISLSGQIDYISPDLPSGSVAETAINLSGVISYISPNLPTSVTERPLQLSAIVSPFVSNPTSENLDAVRTFITETLPAVVVPQISTEGIDTSTALTYLESELVPIITPFINYAGIPLDSLTATGLFIGYGINTGIVQSNIGGAIITEINKAQELIRISGKTSGQNWGAGFLETVGQNVPSALVNLLVALVTPGVQNAINNSGTRTGAQN